MNINHLVVYNDNESIEDFLLWEEACKCFDEIVKHYPEVQLRSWSAAKEDYVPIVTYRESPYFAMRRLREGYTK